MSSILTIIRVCGGLVLFLLGIDTLSAGMEELAGKQIQAWLERMTSNRLKAALFGTTATAVLQSSSLLMVTMIGLINANLLTLEQVINIILGQEIGTTLTGQLVAFDIAKYSFLVLIAGYVLQTLGAEKRAQAVGKALLGLGLVFLGLETMKSGIQPLLEQATARTWLVTMCQTPLLGMLAGASLTALVQSSSATTALTIALGAMGAITLPGAVSLILGANVGTCVTGWIASLRSVKAARRASVAQIFINLFGVALFLPFMMPYVNLISRTSSSLPRQIANAHSIFNISVSLILYPFVTWIVRLCHLLIPGDDTRPCNIAQFLDERLLNVPSIALSQAAKEVVRTGDITCQMLLWSGDALLQMDSDAIQRVLQCEQSQVDPLCAAMEEFLNRLLHGHLSERERRRCFQLKNVITDVERVADMAENLAQAGQERREKQIPFSAEAQVELLRLHGLVLDVWQLAVKALATGDRVVASKVVEGEEHIDQMQRGMRESHQQRLESGGCSAKADIVFVETLRNLERIGDHADNLGVSVLRNQLDSR